MKLRYTEEELENAIEWYKNKLGIDSDAARLWERNIRSGRDRSDLKYLLENYRKASSMTEEQETAEILAAASSLAASIRSGVPE